jgi:tungstate transport system permease protein
MHDLLDALAAAWQLVLSGDPTLVAIVSLSLSISLTAVALASVLGLPWGCRSAQPWRCCGFQVGTRRSWS